MSFLEQIPRRVIFLILIIILTVPVLFPFPISIPISDHTRNYYNTIESLKPRSIVLIGLEVTARDIESYPAMVATFRHLKSKQAVIITYNFAQGAALGTEWIFQDSGYDKLAYSTDYVHLGFMPGGDTTLSSFCQDFVKTKTVDHYGNPTASMPIFQKAKSIQDVDMVLTEGGGTPGPDTWARVAVIPYNKLAIVMVPGAFAVHIYDFLALKVFKGAVIAQRSVVEYEGLTGYTGRATAMFAPPYIGTAVLIVLILISNVAYWYNLSKKKGGKVQ